MKRYYKYGNSGGIKKVQDREINNNSGYYDSLKDLFSSVKDAPRCDLDFKIKPYTFDERLGKDVYMIVCDYGNHSDRFECFFIEEDSPS